MLLWGACAFAQVNTVNGFTAGGGTTDNVYTAIGQPFYPQVAEGDYEISYGVAQAQLKEVTIDTAICFGDGLEKYGYSFSPETPVGTYDSSRYVHNAEFNYDSIFRLIVTVNPVYELYDTLVTYELPAGMQEGDNDLEYQTVAGCDSTVHLYVILCVPVTDYDGNTYNTVIVSGRCWTKENLRSEHDANGADIAGKMVYYSSFDFPNTTDNLNTYGRLYTWTSTVGLPENSTDVPVPGANGYVQGICPDGWHVPDLADMQSLMAHPAPTLRSTNLWLIPGTNTTEFTALPAGLFNPNTSRFEDILSQTGYWTSEPISPTASTTSYFGRLDCWCGEYRIDDTTGNYGFSVRCVKH